MRQFGVTQGVPAWPIAPAKCDRPLRIKGRPGYKLTFTPSQLAEWDSESRTLIELRGPEATHLWDVTEEYVSYIKEYSHPYVDARSGRREEERPRRPHTFETNRVSCCC